MAKRIFVTGGASGLGRALAERYARAGFRVCIGDVNEARSRETVEALTLLGAEAFSLHCDVTREADFEVARAELEQRWGGVDIVVNNAGIASAGSIEGTTLEDWSFVLDINLLGVVRGCKVFTPLFKQQKSGYFVNVSSLAGLMNLPFMGSYNVSKAAVIALSETLQTELVDDGIGVSVVCPSFFKTNLGESIRTSDERLRALTLKLIERGTRTAPEVADMVFDAVESRTFYVLSHELDKRLWLLKRALPRKLFANLVVKRARKFRR